MLNRIYVRFILNVNFAYIQKITSSIKDKIQPRIPSKENLIGRLTTFCAAIMSSFAFFALNKVLEDVPLTIIVENWQGKNELLLVLKSGVEYLVDFTGAKNIEKLCGVVKELSTL